LKGLKNGKGYFYKVINEGNVIDERYEQPNGVWLSLEQAYNKSNYKVTKRPDIQLPTTFSHIGVPVTEMMLTRSTVFSGNKEGTQITYPARTPVTVVGHANDNDLVLYHKSTMRHAIVDINTVKPLMSEEDELVEEACELGGIVGSTEEKTVREMIKAGYRKKPESSERFRRTVTRNDDHGYISDIDTESGMTISCSAVSRELSQELRDYVFSRL